MEEVVCEYLDGKVNLYMRPVWGITVAVDPEEMKIIGFKDRSTMQCRSLTGLTTVDQCKNRLLGQILSRISMAQSDGPSFTIEGRRVR